VSQPQAARRDNRFSSGLPDSDGRPGRDETEVRDWARERDLPYFDGQVHFPDYRIEYEVDGRERHEDVELCPHLCSFSLAAGSDVSPT
jgi:hypothetical protein